MRRATAVGELRKLLADLPAKTLVVTTGHDHSYRSATAGVGTALYDQQSGMLSEDYGEDSTPEADFGKRISVVIVR